MVGDCECYILLLCGEEMYFYFQTENLAIFFFLNFVILHDNNINNKLVGMDK